MCVLHQADVTLGYYAKITLVSPKQHIWAK